MADLSIKHRQEKILSYLEGQNCDPLQFQTFSMGEFVPLTAGSTLMETVSKVIKLAKNYRSWNPKSKRVETRSGALRSAVDIWRHIKSIQPDVSIFSVMEAVYSLIDSKSIAGHYCYTTRRAVFWECLTDHWLIQENFKCREFGIMLSTWKKLH